MAPELLPVFRKLQLLKDSSNDEQDDKWTPEFAPVRYRWVSDHGPALLSIVRETVRGKT
jgi:hypothetical protein